MVAHFELPRADFKIPIRRLAIAINANLPPEIRVQNAVRAPFGFHARFDAAGKEYRYFVWTRPSMNPLLRFHAWHVPAALDLLAMRKAAGFFPGRHDFKSFAANRNYEMESTVRTLKRCQIQRRGPLLVFIIEGDGFLYKMCRGIVGTLVQVGQGKIRPDEVRNILAKRDRRVAGMSAPAHGLVLWRVLYAKRRRVA
jgi:tRNA pseudouridine38-40 synthase